jgi:hypothetical protein
LRSDLLGASIKIEANLAAAQGGDDDDDDNADDAALGGAFNPIDPENFGEFDVDDVEAAVLGDLPVFFAPDRAPSPSPPPTQ